MRKRFKVLCLFLGFTLICSPLVSEASTKVTIIKSSSKSYTVSKKWGSIKKITYKYPDKRNKGKVTIKRLKGKVKITGKKVGKVQAKITFKNKKTKTYSITVKSKSKVTPTPVPTPTVSPSPTPVPTSTPEVEDITNLVGITEVCDIATVDKFEYTTTSIEIKDYDKDGIPNSFFFKVMNLKNISDESLKLDAHVKFYDENGVYLCEYQLSEDSGTNVNKTLSPDEDYMLFMFTASFDDVDKSVLEKVKYWRFCDV